MNIISNTSLNTAKIKRNDEFYTSYSDIENELSHYWNLLKGKSIYCNCDDPSRSNFFKYFSDNFSKIDLNGLMATYYNPITKLGSFDSEECIEILKKYDIVVTNPPFSLASKFFNLMYEYNKKFIILGSINMITYSNIFPYIANNTIRLGYNFSKKMSFTQPDGSEAALNNCCWFTNLNIDIDRHFEFSGITYKGNEEKYHKYDLYDAINIDRCIDIPYDYYDVMGVPITFLGKYNPSQFKIVEYVNGPSFTLKSEENILSFGNTLATMCIPGLLSNSKETKHNGKSSYARVLIQRIK